MSQHSEPEITRLPTEQVNPNTTQLSYLPTRDALQLINNEDRKVPEAVALVIDETAQAVEAISARMLNEGGRLFYVGAGTSGRLGVVDASECPPTFGTPPELVQGIIAGGAAAMFASQEKAEDNIENGANELRDRGLTAADSVIGIAASGRTPFVIGALQYAREVGAFTGGLTVNPNAAIKPYCDVFISPIVGPEAITGSTRMKAGTAQKLVLNMISTAIMLKLGRVEGNLMVDVQPWCGKLEVRARNLVMQLTDADEATAQAALDQTNGQVREAVALLQKS